MGTFTRQIKGSPTKLTGTTPDDAEFESFLEEDFTYLLRFNPKVESYERPEKLYWYDANGVGERYTPDFIVHYVREADGTRPPSVLVEIKPDFKERLAHIPRNEDPERNRQKWEAAKLHAHRRNWAWAVIYEKDIRTNLLKNAKFLLRYLERTKGEYRRDELLDMLRNSGPTEMGQLIKRVSTSREDEALIRPSCYRLIAQRVIHTDLESQVLSGNSILSLSHSQ